jgi:hypothetical protein
MAAHSPANAAVSTGRLRAVWQSKDGGDISIAFDVDPIVRRQI